MPICSWSISSTHAIVSFTLGRADAGAEYEQCVPTTGGVELTAHRAHASRRSGSRSPRQQTRSGTRSASSLRSRIRIEAERMPRSSSSGGTTSGRCRQARASRAHGHPRSRLPALPHEGLQPSQTRPHEPHRRDGPFVAARRADSPEHAHALASRGARLLPLPSHERPHRGRKRQGKARDSASLRI